jgi:hypothetical protein
MKGFFSDLKKTKTLFIYHPEPVKISAFIIFGILIMITAVGGIFFFLSGTKNIDEPQDTLEEVPSEMIMREEPTPPTSEEHEEEEIKEMTTSVPDEKIFEDALTLQDLRSCSKISQHALQNECYDAVLLAKAISNMNHEHCDDIQSNNKKQYCLDYISLEIAKIKKDFSKCQDIKSSTLSSQCQELQSRSQILQAENMSDCSEISSPKKRERCKDLFIAKEIQSQENPQENECKKLSKQEDRKQCKLNVIVQRAGNTLDISLCKELEDMQTKKYCTKQVQKKIQEKELGTLINEGNTEGCENITDEGMKNYCQDRALITRALKEKKPLICHKVQDKKQRALCFNSANTATNAYYYKMAKEKGESKWCTFIPDKNAKKSCYHLFPEERYEEE